MASPLLPDPNRKWLQRPSFAPALMKLLTLWPLCTWSSTLFLFSYMNYKQLYFFLGGGAVHKQMWGGFVSQASLNHVPLRLFKNAYFGVAGRMASGAAAREQTGSSTRRRTGDHASYGVTLGSSTHRSWEHAFTRNLVHGCSRQHHSSSSQSESNRSVHQMMNGFLTMWYIHTGEYYSAIKKECSKK